MPFFLPVVSVPEAFSGVRTTGAMFIAEWIFATKQEREITDRSRSALVRLASSIFISDAAHISGAGRSSTRRLNGGGRTPN